MRVDIAFYDFSLSSMYSDISQFIYIYRQHINIHLCIYIRHQCKWNIIKNSLSTFTHEFCIIYDLFNNFILYRVYTHSLTHADSLKWECAPESFCIINAKIVFAQCSFPSWTYLALPPVQLKSIYLLNILISLVFSFFFCSHMGKVFRLMRENWQQDFSAGIWQLTLGHAGNSDGISNGNSYSLSLSTCQIKIKFQMNKYPKENAKRNENKL